ncbi:VanZ family protein [Hymenobacter sp. PAMC 26628]|uniref:VanZ family protein n=1 Tax=Hymenobacter sp. PAMC 26628 TaxID=1484118 RepID=UPI000AAABCF7|nr:VanZ family protein [Hymenobacter sp. PAMC 26628]
MRLVLRYAKPLAQPLTWLALALYVGAAVYIVFFARRRQDLVWSPRLVNLVPLVNTFRSYQDMAYIGGWNYWSNVFGNVALFIPLPPLLAGATGLQSRRWLLGIGVVASVCIECTQYVLEIGVPDIDDVLLNSLGVLVGIALWVLLFRRIYRLLAY